MTDLTITYLPWADKDARDDEQLYRMCDYGAECQRTDSRVLPRFDIVGCEVDKVKKYMREKHPGIRYQMTYPGGLIR